jgi:hypothetical protein
MERTTIKSSLIRSVAYDAASSQLEVEFVPGKKVTDAWKAAKKEGEAPGPVYRYLAVEQEKFVALTGENEYKSAGKYFLRVIKPHHKAEKVEETPVEKETEATPAE